MAGQTADQAAWRGTLSRKLSVLGSGLIFATMACALSASGTLAQTGASPVEPAAVSIAAARSTTINKKCASGYEVCFEGNSLPGQSAHPYFFWDNPVNERWWDPAVRRTAWRINLTESVAPTYMRIDRTKLDGSGWIARRDENVTYETGAEIRLRLRIRSYSTANGIALIYVDRRSHFAIVFNPKSVVFNPVANQRPDLKRGAKSVTRSLTVFNEFVIRKDPNSRAVSVFAVVNGRNQLILGPLQASLATRTPTQTGYWTTITFGDNQDDVGSVRTRGAVDLDFIRYRRAMPASGVLPVKKPPALPPAETSTAHFIRTYTGVSNAMRFLPSGTGDASKNYTIEWRMRFKSSTEPNGYFVGYLGKLVSHVLVAYPNGVRAIATGKPVSSTLVRPDGYDAKNWTCFRLVHTAGTLRAHVYVNGRMIPQLTDFQSSLSSVLATPMLYYGKNPIPTDPNLLWKSSVTPQRLNPHPAPNVEIDYVRVSNRALAPQRGGCYPRS